MQAFYSCLTHAMNKNVFIHSFKLYCFTTVGRLKEFPKWLTSVFMFVQDNLGLAVSKGAVHTYRLVPLVQRSVNCFYCPEAPKLLNDYSPNPHHPGQTTHHFPFPLASLAHPDVLMNSKHTFLRALTKRAWHSVGIVLITNIWGSGVAWRIWVNSDPNH